MASDIKSTAVVKYTAVEMPAQFHQLQRNTDLKQPPANWLHGSSKLGNNFTNLSFGKGQLFSSFKIGHCYPDLTGEIDVVSDAENIKKLLKMPYSQAPVSMMVHRVANTLLLDDFDIHKHLLRQQQKEWLWLRKFYYETVLQNMRGSIKDRMPVVKKNKSRDHLQNLNLLSKFLHYSIGKSDDTTDKPESCCPNDHQGAALRSSFSNIPDPLPKSENFEPEQQRTFQWTFEDIRMLIGTDLPIFGGHTHPCISLRLRDRRNPINVLTGLDYWLDNLMCNVPEMAMCYHLDGIVQSYEVIKTEDIPSMSKSEFSPNVVKEIAQNILSFLKTNATKEGHTYWLFKGHNDDVVKLYDLTTLCSGTMDDDNMNPFTVPVGMLLYRVARNMRQNNGRRKSGTIRTLLKKCLLLLDRESHPQVVTSAQLLLSDLYISDNIYSLELTPDTSDESDTDDEPAPESAANRCEEGNASAATTSIVVQALCVPEAVPQPNRLGQQVVGYPPVSGDVSIRCREALKHIAKGLACLDDSIANAEKKTRRHTTPTSPSSKHRVEEQVRCNPSMPIPLHYQPIKTQDSKTENSNSTNQNADIESHDEDSTNQMTVFSSGLSLPHGSWQRRSKMLLMRKAAIAYYGLSEGKLEKPGQAWKYAKLALHCFRAMEVVDASVADESRSLLSVILALMGDIHLMIARHTDTTTTHLSDTLALTDEDQVILDSIKLETSSPDNDWLLPFSQKVQDNMERSCKCYQLSLEEASNVTESPNSDRVASIAKRYGNILNELGVHYMNMSATKLAECTDLPDSLPQAKKLWKLSLDCFNAGIEQFNRLEDNLNNALLHSNLGRLHRLCAQGMSQGIDTGQDKREFTPEEAQFFTKAQDSYKGALCLLVERSTHPDIWDSISWELSSTYFTMATMLQDYAPLSTKAQEQVEREVIRLMEKALDLCKVSEDSVRHMACLYRAATIHHRMASLYHNAYRNQVDDKKLRYLRTQAEHHYEMGGAMFIQTDSPCEILRVHLERVALYEYQLNNQTSPLTKMRSLQMALNTLRSCHMAIDSLSQQMAAQDMALTQQEMTGLREEGEKLLGIFISRLQYVAMNLVKNSSAKGKKTSSTVQNSTYKTIYSIILKGTTAESSMDLVTRCQQLSKTLLSLDDLLGEENTSNMEQATGKGSNNILKRR